MSLRMFKESEQDPIKHINVLLVEDHKLTRLGLKAALGKTEDIKIIGEASNGEEAIAQAEELKPDVILMDVGMPIMDGIQASKEILSRNANIRIIMLTQHDNDRDIVASLAAGASGYCLKDVELDRLYTAIRSVNAGDAWLDAGIASRVLGMCVSSKQGEEKSVSAKVVDPPQKQEHPGDNLTPREIEVLKLIVEGLSNQEIADRLVVSLATAKTHVVNILGKLTVHDRTQAAVQALRKGLV